MSNNLRKQVLQSFKALHRTRQQIFSGDTYALTMGRSKINEEYRKKNNLTDIEEIKEAIEYSKAVEKELRTTVIQATEIEPGKYVAKISPEVVKLDNVPFNECGSRKV